MKEAQNSRLLKLAFWACQSQSLRHWKSSLEGSFFLICKKVVKKNLHLTVEGLNEIICVRSLAKCLAPWTLYSPNSSFLLLETPVSGVHKQKTKQTKTQKITTHNFALLGYDSLLQHSHTYNWSRPCSGFSNIFIKLSASSPCLQIHIYCIHSGKKYLLLDDTTLHYLVRISPKFMQAQIYQSYKELHRWHLLKLLWTHEVPCPKW